MATREIDGTFFVIEEYYFKKDSHKKVIKNQ